MRGRSWCEGGRRRVGQVVGGGGREVGRRARGVWEIVAEWGAGNGERGGVPSIANLL